MVYVSADNRYRLYVNGKEVSSGPARGSLMHWRYENSGISAPYLVEGENVITAELFNMGEYRPAAQFSYQTAFIFQAQGPWGSTLNTPGKWLIHQNLAYDPIEVTREVVCGYYVAGPTESIRGSDFPWGWKNPEFDDSHWSKPACYHQRCRPRIYARCALDAGTTQHPSNGTEA